MSNIYAYFYCLFLLCFLSWCSLFGKHIYSSNTPINILQSNHGALNRANILQRQGRHLHTLQRPGRHLHILQRQGRHLHILQRQGRHYHILQRQGRHLHGEGHPGQAEPSRPQGQEDELFPALLPIPKGLLFPREIIFGVKSRHLLQ
jgi:hypothetical protein